MRPRRRRAPREEEGVAGGEGPPVSVQPVAPLDSRAGVAQERRGPRAVRGGLSVEHSVQEQSVTEDAQCCDVPPAADDARDGVLRGFGWVGVRNGGRRWISKSGERRSGHGKVTPTAEGGERADTNDEESGSLTTTCAAAGSSCETAARRVAQPPQQPTSADDTMKRQQQAAPRRRRCGGCYWARAAAAAGQGLLRAMRGVNPALKSLVKPKTAQLRTESGEEAARERRTPPPRLHPKACGRMPGGGRGEREERGGTRGQR